MGASQDRGERAQPLEPGDRVPPFALPDENGESATLLADHVAGKPVVLALHTGGTDTESSFADELAAFRDAAPDFATLEATIFAVTRASVADNRRLRDRMALPFQVLSDPEGHIGRVFGLGRLPGADGAVGDVPVSVEKREAGIVGL